MKTGWPSAVIAALASATLAAGSPPNFTYRPPGELAPGSGKGRADPTIYLPGMRFPIESAPAFANSQNWGKGGDHGNGGSQCDAPNYLYPWWDNYCETRSWKMPLCPAGEGHQGQDIRPQSCRRDTYWAVAAIDGKITSVGSYSVYLTAPDGTRVDYLHMSNVAVRVGQSVEKGDRLGLVSDYFGGRAKTTIHLHFNIFMATRQYSWVYVPPYTSLVEAYQVL